MELAKEDTLRLNVLLANKPQAIRIDESAMVVYGLLADSEAKIQLNPSGRHGQYLRKVRELLSGHILGSPGGYPVYLKRWTRMGQMREQSLEHLLLLGEPEAVVAAVCAPGIDDDLARKAWWVMEDAENARQLLNNDAVRQGRMGKVLAAYLLDYLPFETETERMIESIRLLLQPGLIDTNTRQELWKRATRKPAYYVGFLAAIPDNLPEDLPPHSQEQTYQQPLALLGLRGNPVAQILLRVLAATGQTFLRTTCKVLQKPPNQDVVTTTLDILREYFSPLRPDGDPNQELSALSDEAKVYCMTNAAAKACCDLGPLEDKICAIRILSGMGYGVVRPVFRDTTAIGSLMRKKMAPVVEPVLDLLLLLQGQD